MQMLYHIGTAFLTLWIDAAFWLILGLVIAGLLRTFLNSDNIGRHLRGPGLWPAIKAAILGTPIPLCSCGVIPAAIGLRRAGASKSATTAFLISTPETGIDSIAISYALLGPFMAIIRPIAALSSAIVAAALVAFREQPELTGPFRAFQPLTASETPLPFSLPDPLTTEPHHHDHHDHHESSKLLSRIIAGQKFAFTELIEDLAIWLIIGLLISAIVVTLVPADALATMTQGPAAMIIMALIGVPMYICATASTPLAAGLMMAGVSPGAILVFLLAGPATNIATLGIVKNELGKHALLSYLGGVVIVAIGFGYLTNYLISAWHINIQSELASSNEFLPEYLSWITAILLAGILLHSLYHKLFRKTYGCSDSSCHCHH